MEPLPPEALDRLLLVLHGPRLRVPRRRVIRLRRNPDTVARWVADRVQCRHDRPTRPTLPSRA